MDSRVIMKVDWTKQGNCLDIDRIRLKERSKNEFVVLRQMMMPF